MEREPGAARRVSLDARRISEDARRAAAQGTGARLARRQGIEHRPHQPGDGRQVLARSGSDRQAIRSGQRPDEVVRGGRRHRQHPVARPDPQQPLRVLSHDRPGVVRLDGRRRPHPRRRSHRHHPVRAPDRGVDRSLAADHPGADDGGGGRGVGGPAAPDVGADGALRCARGTPGDDRRLWCDGATTSAASAASLASGWLSVPASRASATSSSVAASCSRRSASPSAPPAPGCSVESSRRC